VKNKKTAQDTEHTGCPYKPRTDDPIFTAWTRASYMYQPRNFYI